ncbi:unnamed protein product, partial [Prunus brigantina]
LQGKTSFATKLLATNYILVTKKGISDEIFQVSRQKVLPNSLFPLRPTLRCSHIGKAILHRRQQAILHLSRLSLPRSGIDRHTKTPSLKASSLRVSKKASDYLRRWKDLVCDFGQRTI